MSDVPAETPEQRAARWRAEEQAGLERRWRDHGARAVRATALAGTAGAAAMTIGAIIATAGGWSLVPFILAGYGAAAAIAYWRLGTTRSALLVGALGIGLCRLVGALFFVGWIAFPVTGVVLAIWIGLERDR